MIAFAATLGSIIWDNRDRISRKAKKAQFKTGKLASRSATDLSRQLRWTIPLDRKTTTLRWTIQRKRRHNQKAIFLSSKRKSGSLQDRTWAMTLGLLASSTQSGR